MMLSRLLNALLEPFRRPREHYDPSGDPFLELDLSDVRRQLKPTELGQENGAKELPASEATSLDHVERGIVAFFANELERCVKECELRLSSYADRLRGLRVTTAIPDIVASADSTRQDLWAIAGRGRNELFAEKERLAGLNADLVDFREKNRLTRQALYPDSRLKHYGLLAVMLLVEIVLNGFMLAKGSDFGYVGGGAQALLLALVNLSVSFSAGKWALPNVHHRHWLRRALAYASMILFVASALGFNLAVGHYRDALVALDQEPAKTAIATLAKAPFVLADIQSYLLLAIGLLFAVIAAADGYKTDDPYPGYGELTRLVVQAQEEFAAARRMCADDLAECRDAGMQSIKQLAQSIELAQRQNGELRARQQQITKRFQAHQEYLTRSVMALLSDYRSANVAVRVTRAPTYFNAETKLPNIALAEFGESELRNADVTQAIQQASNTISGAFDAAMSDLPTVEQLSTPEETERAHANAR